MGGVKEVYDLISYDIVKNTWLYRENGKAFEVPAWSIPWKMTKKGLCRG